jgi:Tol biopolymer transport system component
MGRAATALLVVALILGVVAGAAGSPTLGSAEIVFVARARHTGPHLVFTVRSDGRGLHQLPLGRADAVYWSPNGKKVATVGSAITLQDADGSGVVRLEIKCGGGCDLAWAPDGARLAYTVTDDCGKAVCPSRLGVVRADGKNRRALFRFTGAHVASPAWAPDGSQIAFVEEANGVADLDVVRPNGRGFTRLVPADGTAYSPTYHPSWAANSARILFSASRGGTVRVLSVTRDGSELRTLAAGSLPVVSPDGKRVAFIRAGSAYVMSMAGGKQTKVATGVVSPLAWSPDSDKLAYVTTGQKIAVATADGSETRPITKAYGGITGISWRGT